MRIKIQDVFDIEERIERAEYFIKYLDSIWKNFDKKNVYLDWECISKYLKKNIETIKEKIQNTHLRNY